MIYRLPKRIAGDLASGTVVGVFGIPVACIAVLWVLGLLLYPMAGPAAWDPAHSFAVAVLPALLLPLFWLAVAVSLFAVTAGFGHWCLLMKPTITRDTTLLSLVRRFEAIASSLPFPGPLPGRLDLVELGGSILGSSSRRMATPNAAVLSGASPLLE